LELMSSAISFDQTLSDLLDGVQREVLITGQCLSHEDRAPRRVSF
jgi:hypothetical protein